MGTSTHVRRVLLLVVLFALSGPASADARTDRVIVYNGGTADDYDNAAHGFAWQEAGFLGPDGAPRRTNAEGNIVDEGGTVVGRPVRVGGRTIGYVNAAGTVTVVDLSIGTFSEAFDQVTNTGTIQVVKHGGYIDTDNDGAPTDADQLGGSLQLDRGTYFEGFGRGTGQNSGSTPYALTGRTDGRITFDLRCCWSGRDPDGAAGAATSVAATATTVNGVTNATGSQTMTRLGPRATFTFSGGATDTQVTAAINAALPGGFRDFGDWVASLPFVDQLRLLRERFATVTIGGRRITLTWRITYAFGTGAGGALEITPQNVQSRLGAVLRHTTLSGTGLEALFELEPLVDTDTVPEWEHLATDRLPDLPFFASGGLDLLSGIYSLYQIDDSPVERLGGTVTLDLLPEAVLDTATLYLLRDSIWLPLASEIVGDSAVRAFWNWNDLRFGHTPVFAAFGELSVPEPGVLLLMSVAGVLGMARRRQGRKR